MLRTRKAARRLSGGSIAARANTDVKVKAIALWYRRPPNGIFVRTDSPIK